MGCEVTAPTFKVFVDTNAVRVGELAGASAAIVTNIALLTIVGIARGPLSSNVDTISPTDDPIGGGDGMRIAFISMALTPRGRR